MLQKCTYGWGNASIVLYISCVIYIHFRNWALPIKYQLLFILKCELLLFEWYIKYLFSYVFLCANYFLRYFPVNRKSIALTKRPVVKWMIQLGFVVRHFYNSLVTVCAHKEARNSFARTTNAFPHFETFNTIQVEVCAENIP